MLSKYLHSSREAQMHIFWSKFWKIRFILMTRTMGEMDRLWERRRASQQAGKGWEERKRECECKSDVETRLIKEAMGEVGFCFLSPLLWSCSVRLQCDTASCRDAFQWLLLHYISHTHTHALIHMLTHTLTHSLTVNWAHVLTSSAVTGLNIHRPVLNFSEVSAC